MIRADYRSYLGKLKDSLRDFNLDYSRFDEDNLRATFYLSNGWILELNCERFGSGVTVEIRNPTIGRREGYAVWILMKAFESLTGKTYGDPSVENQVRFLAEEKRVFFSRPDFYEVKYAKLNDVD